MRWSDGTEGEALTWYADEILVCEGAVVGKSLEQFFGAPMTPEREKALLENVKSQLAGKDKPQMDVRIAGWWPDEGVMAVSVVPRG